MAAQKSVACPRCVTTLALPVTVDSVAKPTCSSCGNLFPAHAPAAAKGEAASLALPASADSGAKPWHRELAMTLDLPADDGRGPNPVTQTLPEAATLDRYYVPVGLVQDEPAQELALIEFPQEGECGGWRMWVRKADLLFPKEISA